MDDEIRHLYWDKSISLVSDRRLFRLSHFSAPFRAMHVWDELEKRGIYRTYAAANLLGCGTVSLSIFLPTQLLVRSNTLLTQSPGVLRGRFTAHFDLRAFLPLVGKKSPTAPKKWAARSAPFILDSMRMVAPVKKNNGVGYSRVWKKLKEREWGKVGLTTRSYSVVAIRDREMKRNLSFEQAQARIDNGGRRFRNRVSFWGSFRSLELRWIVPCRTPEEVGRTMQRLDGLRLLKNSSFVTSNMRKGCSD